MEPDPDDSGALFVLTDEQRIYKIAERGDGKVRPESSVNLAGHDLEADLAEAPIWMSHPVSDRMISLGILRAPGGDYFSMQTKFAWKADDEGLELAMERNLPGTLYALQLWRR